MKKKLAVFSTIIVVILIGVISISVLHHKSQIPDSPATPVSKVDFATQAVISENLFLKNNLQFSNGLLKLNGYYFDGNRLYVSISLNNSEALSDLNKNSFYLKSKNYEKNADMVYDSEDIGNVIGRKTNDYIVIFNSFNYSSKIKYFISYNDSNTEEFYIKGSIAQHQEIGTSNEEMILNFAEFGTTSTLINCDISAFLEDSSFQFQTKDDICTAYLIKKEGNNYSLLIPLKLIELSEGYLIVNDQDENVKLRAFVSFAKNDPDSLI